MKNILYVYQNYRGSYSSASLSILRGLRKIKHFNTDDFEIEPISKNHLLNRIFNRLPFLRSLHFKKENERLLKKISKKKYSVVFIMKGTDLKPNTLERITIEYPELKLCCFNPDDPFNNASSNPDIVSSIPIYDYYCIWTKKLNNQLKNAGAKKVIYLPFGVDREIIYHVESEFQYDISFVGNGDTERHQLIIALNEEILKRGLDFSVHIFGSNWTNMGERVIVHSQRNGIQLLKTISASKVNLNLLRKQNKNSINMRTFEIPAANGFMLHELSEEARTFFTANKEVVYFSSIEDLVDKCILYLKDNEKRKRICANAFNKIQEGDYSYKKLIDMSMNEILN